MSTSRFRRSGRLAVALASVLTLALSLGACSSGDGSGKPTLTVGFQTADWPELIETSGLFDDLPYRLETPVIAGPAAQISALHSKATDVGLVGENTAAFEAANGDEDLSVGEPKIYTVAGIAHDGSEYPQPALFVKKSAGINQLSDLRGKSIAYNFGGNIYAAFVKILADAGLTVDDIEPVQLTDNPSAAAAFNSGSADAVVTSFVQVAKQVESGDAELLATNKDLKVKGGAGFITRPDVLADPSKKEAAEDFFGRLSKLWSDWVPGHEEEVTGIYTGVLKQSPDIAKINYDNAKYGRLYKVGDPQFIQEQQAIVNAAYEAGGVKNKYDIAPVFNPVFDDVTVPDPAAS